MAGLFVWFLIFFILALFFVVQFYNLMFRGYAPYISTGAETIAKIVAAIDLKEDGEVFELGAGKAGFLRALEKKFPKARLIGVEYAFWPWLLANIQISLSKSRIKAIKENLFKTDLSRADLIYCYLNSKMMQALGHKFKKECRLGTTIISYAFPIKKWTAAKTIDLAEKGKVYFYQV